MKHQTRPWNIFNCRSPAGCVRDGAADGVLGDATGAPPQRPRLGGGCHNTRSVQTGSLDYMNLQNERKQIYICIFTN